MNINTRNIAAGLALLLAATAAPTHAQSRWNDYRAQGGTVTYQGQQLPDADAASFAELGFGYAKDRYNVYYRGEVLEFVDPSSFRVSARFTRHHTIGTPTSPAHKVQAGPETSGVKPAASKTQRHNSFDLLGSLGADEAGAYAVTDGRVTYEGRQVKGADAATFEVLQAGYAKDARHAYYCGRLISGALGGNYFDYTGDDYATDGLHTYFKGKEVVRD
jgi:hypothetical protein